MASQGQAVARQSNRWLEPFVIALAIAAIMITLAWGAFTALSAPSTVAPSKTTEQVLQEPGLLQQRAGERGGAVVSTTPVYNPFDPALQGQPTSAPGNPYVNIHVPDNKPVFRKPVQKSVISDRPAVSVHPRGHSHGRD